VEARTTRARNAPQASTASGTSSSLRQRPWLSRKAGFASSEKSSASLCTTSPTDGTAGSRTVPQKPWWDWMKTTAPEHKSKGKEDVKKLSTEGFENKTNEN
jgi:hypothetical protein